LLAIEENFMRGNSRRCRWQSDGGTNSGSGFNKSVQNGFSYIDVMIGIVILMVGILASAGALTANLIRSHETEKQVIAKQIALSTIESIFSARDIARVGGVEGWDSIGNEGSNPVGGVNRGIFLTGWRPIREDHGWDGVTGTIDDACDAGAPCVVPRVVNNVSITTTNDSPILDDFERQIVITDLQDPERPSPPHKIARRRIDVSVRYNVNRLQRQQTISTIIANYGE
jgi:type II secretory pathway pseudopilin PulG